ncbi:50S ribosomal protein L4 [Candidatus Poribacteria bacterium]|jgi:large subunit ribosomal protein L4|nr:50S ribosomal protein L4 [Candidatus Poribacteria bacterium]MEE2912065.1 50S ribosomal protein L4 [Candidatus Poribacteria bacterium]|tara:strand:- start:218 stop:838 length:621 start_codon:yes stop_codon:yes gene_type:complete
MSLDVYNRSGEIVRQQDIPAAFSNTDIDPGVVHQCIVAYLANQRRGTASTKTRGEVKGSGRKLYRQKGTGRARAGDAKSPIRVHGGVTFGPRPRSYRQYLPKKVRRLGVHYALADKLQSQSCKIIEDFELAQPKTKDVLRLLDALSVTGKSLIVLGKNEHNIHLSARNIPGVNTCTWDLINVYQVLWHENLILTESAMQKLEEKFA